MTELAEQQTSMAISLTDRSWHLTARHHGIEINASLPVTHPLVSVSKATQFLNPPNRAGC